MVYINYQLLFLKNSKTSLNWSSQKINTDELSFCYGDNNEEKVRYFFSACSKGSSVIKKIFKR